ncbi:MAG: HPP family protein [Hyphomicrobiales bacterium]
MNISQKKYISHIIFQILLATVLFFILIYFVGLRFKVTLATIGATTFIIFISPGSESARSRNVILGTIIGCIIGYIGWLFQSDSHLFLALSYSIVIGVTAILLVVFRCFHPPAAGYSLGIAFEGYNSRLIIGLLIMIVVLVLVHEAFGYHLVNLIERKKVTKLNIRKKKHSL